MMRRKYYLAAGVVFGVCLVLIASSGVLQTAFAQARAPEAAPLSWHTDFDGPLDDRWYWASEDPDSWSVRNGYLHMTAQSPPQILYQDAPQEDFIIQTAIDFIPSENFQFAGLRIQGEQSDYYMQLGRAFCDLGEPICVGDGIYFDMEESGVFGDNFATTLPITGTIHLRIVRKSYNYLGYISPDGMNWTHIGTHSVGFEPVSIGLIATDSGQFSSWNEAQYDFFDVLFPEPMSAFTYQGVLGFDGQAVNDVCDFQLILFDSPGDDTRAQQIGRMLELFDVEVKDGHFTVSLDFGGEAFQGEPRYLEMAVRCPRGSGDFTTLSPRQLLASTPYAVYAYQTDWYGIQNMPGGFTDGEDNVNSYYAGTGLELAFPTFNVADSFQLPQDCQRWQVPLWNPDTSMWTCGTVQVEVPLPQNVGHSIEYLPTTGKPPAPLSNIWIDLDRLKNYMDVIQYQDGGDLILHKRPGIHRTDNFDIYCSEGCGDLVTWYESVVSGLVQRRDLAVVVLDASQQEVQRWHMTACWPNAYDAVPGSYGETLDMKFSIACETQVLEINPAAQVQIMSLPDLREPNPVGPPSPTGISGAISVGSNPVQVPVDISRLAFGTETEVTEYQDGDEIILRKSPGRTLVDVFSAVCLDNCFVVSSWYEAVILGIFNREALTLQIFDDQQQVTHEYLFSDCWPSSETLVMSGDMAQVFPEFTFACEVFEIVQVPR